jgi:hypothetical protein
LVWQKHLKQKKRKKVMDVDSEGPTDKSSVYFGDNLIMRLHDEDFKEMAALDSMNKSTLKAIGWVSSMIEKELL